jgi:hypothetical protein
MKTEYNIKDQVWIHLGERKLIEGRVVDIINLEHLNEGHSKNREFYIIEIETGIDDIYEVRTFDQISSTARGPINIFKNIEDFTKNNRYLKKVGMVTPLPIDSVLDILNDDVDPTTEEIHAALEKSQKDSTHSPLIIKETKPKRRNYPPRKKKV